MINIEIISCTLIFTIVHKTPNKPTISQVIKQGDGRKGERCTQHTKPQIRGTEILPKVAKRECHQARDVDKENRSKDVYKGKEKGRDWDNR